MRPHQEINLFSYSSKSDHKPGIPGSVCCAPGEASPAASAHCCPPPHFLAQASSSSYQTLTQNVPGKGGVEDSFLPGCHAEAAQKVLPAAQPSPLRDRNEAASSTGHWEASPNRRVNTQDFERSGCPAPALGVCFFDLFIFLKKKLGNAPLRKKIHNYATFSPSLYLAKLIHFFLRNFLLEG